MNTRESITKLMEGSGFESTVPAAMEMSMNPNEGKLMEIRLEEGDVPGLNLGWVTTNGARRYNPQDWLSQGYAGVRFIGKGRDKTWIRNASWDSNTIAAGNFPGIVRLESLSIECATPDKGKGIHYGLPLAKDGIPRGSVDPSRSLQLFDCNVNAADRFAGEGSSTWGIFTYNVDVVLESVTIDGAFNNEHNLYAHGTAGQGIFVKDCDFKSSGAEGLKLRSDSSETLWAGPLVTVKVENTRFADWYQPWSWRGGAAIVVQGGAAHVDVKNCTFHPGKGHDKAGDYTRSYCFAVSGEGDSYDILTGRISEGFGNGYVRLQNCLMESSGPGPSWLKTIARVGSNAGSQIPAMGVLIKNCGIWGENMSVQIAQDIPFWAIEGCNTERIAEYARANYGMAAEHEAVYFSNGLKPISEDRPFAATPGTR